MGTLVCTTNNKIMIAFDGKTYFVKWKSEYMAKWYPVKNMNINLNGDCRVIGVYGWNCGKRTQIVNRKGQSVADEGIRFNLKDFIVNNRVKLYASNVKTEVRKVYPIDMLEEAYTFNSNLDTYRQVLSLLNDEEKKVLISKVSEEYRKYL